MGDFKNNSVKRSTLGSRQKNLEDPRMGARHQNTGAFRECGAPRTSTERLSSVRLLGFEWPRASAERPSARIHFLHCVHFVSYGSRSIGGLDFICFG